MDPRRAALIIASYDYQDPELRQLRAPVHDAKALERVLGDPGIGAFDVRSILNEPAHLISEAVEGFFADRTSTDLLLVHFSCHGIKDENGELYLAASNTKLGRLGATAVSADFVNRRMNRSRSRRIILLLDCCYAGAFERGMVARAGMDVGIETQLGGRGRVVITASSALEYAFEGTDLTDSKEPKPSVFTNALVEGLETGDADRDQDGYVALDELYDYVYDKVREATPHQTPGMWAFGVQGDLYVAHRNRSLATSDVSAPQSPAAPPQPPELASESDWIRERPPVETPRSVPTATSTTPDAAPRTLDLSGTLVPDQRMLEEARAGFGLLFWAAAAILVAIVLALMVFAR
jgi:uncharacterized caspase-like protein